MAAAINKEPTSPTRPSERNEPNQLPYRAPSVFNFYQPDYQPPGFESYAASGAIPNGKLYGPEYQIFTSVIANRFANLFYRHLHTGPANTNRIDFSSSFKIEEKLVASDAAALLRRLDLLMCHGSLSDQSQLAIIAAMSARGTPIGNPLERAKEAILAVVTSPECAVDE